MDNGYPLLLDLTGRRAVVVGGGAVGARRAASLADAGAIVQVIAPRVSKAITTDPRLAVIPRPYTAADLTGTWLVHTCTGVPAVDDAVAADADAAGIWCVRSGSAVRSRAWTPAVARVDDVVVAVNAGADPRRAQRVRDSVAGLLTDGTIPQRRHRRAGGRVALVGGGPGDPDLLTVRGHRLLADADVVAVDHLAPQAPLSQCRPDAEIIDVGKRPGLGGHTQHQINELLVERARRGKLVVRLKGGDPFVFGRGGEELAACRAAGVPCTVVPGVSSAVAVPAAAGIPVTHRGLARQFTVLTGHTDLDYDTAAAIDGTLVILMGATRVELIAKGLLEAGKHAATPVAVIENGTLPQQRSTVGTLGTIGALARDARTPAVIVIGPVVNAVATADEATGQHR